MHLLLLCKFAYHVVTCIAYLVTNTSKIVAIYKFTTMNLLILYFKPFVHCNNVVNCHIVVEKSPIKINYCIIKKLNKIKSCSSRLRNKYDFFI